VGNSNSGRRPRREEERKLIGKYFTAAVSVVVEMLNDPKTPKHVRLDAARVLIDQHIGRPSQRMEHTGDEGEAIVIHIARVEAKSEATESSEVLEGADATTR